MDVRRATARDAAELTRLRHVMLNSSRPTPGGDWLADCAAALAERLQGPAFAAFVLDAPDGPGLASCAVATFTPVCQAPTAAPPMSGRSTVSRPTSGGAAVATPAPW